MKTWRRNLSGREGLLVAAALLLPIPLFAQSGLSVPLPGVDRGLGSLVTVDATDERSGSATKQSGSENATGDRRSSGGSPSIGRGERLQTLPGQGAWGSDGGGDSAVFDMPGGEAGDTLSPPAGGGAAGGSDGGVGSRESPGGPDGPAAPESSTEPGSSTQPGVSVTGQGQGARPGISAGTGGIGVDVGADNADAGSDEPGSVGVEVTSVDGSNRGAGTTLPGVGIPSP